MYVLDRYCLISKNSPSVPFTDNSNEKFWLVNYLFTQMESIRCGTFVCVSGVSGRVLDVMSKRIFQKNCNRRRAISDSLFEVIRLSLQKAPSSCGMDKLY